MPRYFFDLHDGVRERDERGVELPDTTAARIEAIRFAGDSARDDPSELDATGVLAVVLSDERHVPLYHVEVRVTAADQTDG